MIYPVSERDAELKTTKAQLVITFSAFIDKLLTCAGGCRCHSLTHKFLREVSDWSASANQSSKEDIYFIYDNIIIL